MQRPPDARQKAKVPIYLLWRHPRMELHLVIISKVYFYCLFQPLCPFQILAIQTWLNV